MAPFVASFEGGARDALRRQKCCNHMVFGSHVYGLIFMIHFIRLDMRRNTTHKINAKLTVMKNATKNHTKKVSMSASTMADAYCARYHFEEQV